MSHRQNGFALLIVLWTVGFLALLGTQIVASGRSDTRLADNLKQAAVLEAAADGAVANVMYSIVAANDQSIRPDGLVREVHIGQTPVRVQVEKETDRVSLNTASAPLLRALIIEVGGTPAVANAVAAAILDWRTEDTDPRPSGAEAPRYRAAGRVYGPPKSPFRSVEELADVMYVTPALFARLAPHLTVWTDTDPEMSTHDPVVARALADVAGVADVTGRDLTASRTFRISVVAFGTGASRYSRVVVAAADFQNAPPRVDIMLRERGQFVTSDTLDARDNE
jgi:general secretion pathway protein K